MILPIEIKYLNTTQNTEATAMVAVELPLTRHFSVKTTTMLLTYMKKKFDQTTSENAVQFY